MFTWTIQQEKLQVLFMRKKFLCVGHCDRTFEHLSSHQFWHFSTVKNCKPFHRNDFNGSYTLLLPSWLSSCGTINDAVSAYLVQGTECRRSVTLQNVRQNCLPRMEELGCKIFCVQPGPSLFQTAFYGLQLRFHTPHVKLPRRFRNAAGLDR